MRELGFRTLFTAGVLGIFGCGSGPTWKSIKTRIGSEFPEVHHVSVDELNRMLESGGPKPLILDVREEEEFAVSHLPGAVRVDPDASAGDVIDALDIGPDTTVIAYCSVGYRSSRLVDKLASAGVVNAKNLDGSIFEWANRGHALERDGRDARKVHPFDDEWGVLLEEELHAYEPEAR